ncbi:MAG: heparan-alpha-glucosaminide N-acetyltransferase domain-containing protein [Betaproteobacteria bacterium]
MPSPARLPLVDALRGFAIAQMIVYHFIYDLTFFGWYGTVMARDPVWIAWRTAITTQFLLLVGVGLVLRAQWRPSIGDFAWRWVQVAAAAALVSAGSALVVGPLFVRFGILHFVAVALLLAWPLARLGMWNLVVAAGVLLLWAGYSDPRFNSELGSIVGLGIGRPRSIDYVPIFPWFAAVAAGLALGALWQKRGFALAGPAAHLNERPPRLLVALGRWPLTAYLLHQPLLLGALWLFKTLA